MSRRPRILIVKTGTAAPVITERHGDYDRWFMEALGEPERFAVVEVHKGDALPSLKGFDGAIITGSPLSVCDPAPWMEANGATLREWAERGEAVLGVCFGHQLLSHAFGAPVIKNPNGREIGTMEIELTPAGLADPLFEGLGDRLRFQATHTDIASAVPAGSILLASNANTAVQAAKFGRRARGVQFHPELTHDAVRTLIGSRIELMAKEGLDGHRYIERVEKTPAGVQVLRRFEERLVGG
jgi:GMP synthase (glutamine-hydrolysing)